MNRLIIALLGSVLYSGASMAQKQTYFTNPVIHGDVADPSILRIDDTYYATGTSSEWAPYYPVVKPHLYNFCRMIFRRE